MKDIQNKLLASVEKLFERKQFKSLKELLSTMEPADIAEVLAEKAPAERVFLFRRLPKDIAIEVFEFLEGAEREELLGSFTDTEVAAIIEEMSDDDRTALFDELPAKTVKKLLAHLSPEERKLANALLNYQADSAGRIMTPEFIDLPETMTASQALARIRATAAKKETIYTSFVVSPERKLKGTVHLEDLILASPDTPVTDFMDGLPVFVTTDTDQEEAAKTMSKYDLQTIPVVDRESRLVGILTFDDILDIVQEEATEDFERMAGIQPIDEKYLDTGVFTLARKRLTWLVICIMAQAISSSVLKKYSLTIESVVALTFFIPLLIGTGGNAGMQSATLMIRGMTLGDIEWKNLGHVLLRETLTGLLLGIPLGLLAIGRAYMLDTGPSVAMVVAFALVAVVLLGNLAGVALPVIARAVRIDPAVMSGPFITTTVDVVGLLVYFEIARRVLGVG